MLLKSLKYNLNSNNCLIFNRVMSKKGKKSNKSEQKAAVPELSPITIDNTNQIVLQILAKPGAKQNAITDISPEGIGVQINAPPSEGEANAELVKFISSVLGLRKSDVSFTKGFKSRQKTLKVTCNLTPEQIKEKLLSEIE